MLKEYVLEVLFDKLDSFIDQEVNVNYAGYRLMYEEYVIGTITYSHDDAKNWIINNFDELGKIVKKMNSKMSVGYSRAMINPFLFPEEFMVEVIIYMITKDIKYAMTVLGIDADTIILSEQLVHDIKNIWKK